MKIRTLTLITVAIMLISLFTVTAMADEQDKIKQKDQLKLNDGSCLLTTFVDEDGDGVCDNFVDEDGDGICDNCQGDGVCDGDGPHGNSRGYGNGDGDGVCDGPCATD